MSQPISAAQYIVRYCNELTMLTNKGQWLNKDKVFCNGRIRFNDAISYLCARLTALRYLLKASALEHDSFYRIYCSLTHVMSYALRSIDIDRNLSNDTIKFLYTAIKLYKHDDIASLARDNKLCSSFYDRFKYLLAKPDDILTEMFIKIVIKTIKEKKPIFKYIGSAKHKSHTLIDDINNDISIVNQNLDPKTAQLELVREMLQLVNEFCDNTSDANEEDSQTIISIRNFASNINERMNTV